MPTGPRRLLTVRSFWAGIGAVAFCFCLTMGSLNAWQLAERGVQVRGDRLGGGWALVDECHRDPLTLWQGWSCDARLLSFHPGTSVTMSSVEPLEGEVEAEVWAGGRRLSDLIVVPSGTAATFAQVMPTDVAVVAWLVAVAGIPMALAIRGGWRRSAAQPNPFDGLSANWDDDPRRKKRAELVAAQIRERTTPGGRWLDYGAGTGLLGMALLGHADRFVLVDTSRGMVDKARTKIAAAGLDTKVTAVDVDLAQEDGSGLGEMDGIVSQLALHHINDVPLVLERMAALLRPGGWIAIADLDADGGGYHANEPGVPHNGFEREQIKVWFVAAGLGEPQFSTPTSMTKAGREYPLFLAVAQRP